MNFETKVRTSPLKRMQEENARLKAAIACGSERLIAQNLNLMEENAKLKKLVKEQAKSSSELDRDGASLELMEENAKLKKLVKELEQDSAILQQQIEKLFHAEELEALGYYKKSLKRYARAIEEICTNGLQERDAFLLLLHGGTKACRKYLQQLKEAKLRQESV